MLALINVDFQPVAWRILQQAVEQALDYGILPAESSVVQEPATPGLDRDRAAVAQQLLKSYGENDSPAAIALLSTLRGHQTEVSAS